MSATTTRPPAESAPITRTVARQSGVVGAQVAAGLGNLAFSIVAVRALPSGHYAQFASFLAAYLLINTPAASLTAGASLRPDLAHRLQPIALRLGFGIGAVLALFSPWLAGAARLPLVLILLLALDAPVAGVLALARGHLFGQHRLGAAATAIVSEPLVRCAVGLVLLPLAGTVGAAVGVLAGGYVALGVCVWLRQASAVPETRGRRPAAPATVVSFLLLAVLGAQDVIIANRVLPADRADVFAAVSTLGGAVLFATAMVPIVVLAQLRGRQRHATGSALGVTAVVSVFGSVVLLVLPQALYTAVLGPVGYRIGSVLPAYLLAMTLLCLARVLLASLCARGLAARAVAATVAACGVQVALLVGADTATAAAVATLAGSAVLLAATGALALAGSRRPDPAQSGPAMVAEPELTGSVAPAVGQQLTPTVVIDADEDRRARHRRTDRARWGRRWFSVDLGWVLALCAAAVAVRLSTDRSVWIDEAISVHEASQPFGQMLHLLRTTDVHPPLYFSLLWLTIHLTGATGEVIVRIPSLVPGVVLVAVAYYAARDIWDRRTARFAGVVAVIGPAAVWYSQDARMYALFMLFSTVATWMLIRILRAARPRARELAVFTAACAALLWTQYDTFFAVLTLVVIFVGVGVRRWVTGRNRRLLARALGSTAAIVALCLPLIPWVLQQYGHTKGLTASVPAQAGTGTGTAPHAGLNAYSILADGVWAVFGYHSDQVMVLINALWPLLLLLVLVSLGRGGSAAGRVIAAVAFVPPAILFVLGQQRPDLFDLRYFAATVPMLNLLLARMAASWVRGRFTRIAVPVLLIAALGCGLADEQVNRSNPRVYDFRSAVQFVRANSGPHDLLLYGPTYLSSELDYYRPGVDTRPITGVPQTQGDPHVFVLGSFLNTKGAAGQVGTAVVSLKQHRHLQRVVHFPNVTVWEFS